MPSLKTNIKAITNSLFVLLNNYASPGAAKEGTENFELIMTCFKVANIIQYHTHFMEVSGIIKLKRCSFQIPTRMIYPMDILSGIGYPMVGTVS